MTNKPYIKDFESADWMSEKFGVVFDRYERDNVVFLGKEASIASEEGEGEGKYYIHSDSLHIFESQVGDLIRGTLGATTTSGMEYYTYQRDDMKFFDYRNPEVGGIDD